MVTFKKAENELRNKAETYLGCVVPPEQNVYAAVEGELVGAGVLKLNGGRVEIVTVKAEPEYAEFTLRSTVFVASNIGLPIVGDSAELKRFGFREENGKYICAADKVMFPCECKGESK